MSSKWVPLEASPEVFNADLFSLDDEFLAFVPQPVKAVLLLFPSRGELAKAREEEERSGEGKYEGNVWWIKQTIPNACGSIGLLHALLNLPDGSLQPNSALVKFKEASLGLGPLERAQLLDSADFFTTAHTSAAQEGQSTVPEGEALNVDTHFIAFVEAKNAANESRVIELDGGRTGPFDRGACTNLLRDVAKIVQEKYFARAGDAVHFNMIVLAGDGE